MANPKSTLQQVNWYSKVIADYAHISVFSSSEVLNFHYFTLGLVQINLNLPQYNCTNLHSPNQLTRSIFNRLEHWYIVVLKQF